MIGKCLNNQFYIVSQIVLNQGVWFCYKKQLHWRHIQSLQYILELEVTSLFVESFNQLVPRIIDVKGLSGLYKPFCLFIGELAREDYITTNKYQVFAIGKFRVMCNSEIGGSLSSPSFIIFQPGENYVWDLHCKRVGEKLELVMLNLKNHIIGK